MLNEDYSGREGNKCCYVELLVLGFKIAELISKLFFLLNVLEKV